MTNPNAQSLYPDDTQVTYILSLLNNIRSQIRNPTAADMVQLTWDYGLALNAQNWAQSCIYGYDCNNCRSLVNNATVSVGQIGATSRGGKYDSKYWSYVINSWAREFSNFEYGRGSRRGM